MKPGVEVNYKQRLLQLCFDGATAAVVVARDKMWACSPALLPSVELTVLWPPLTWASQVDLRGGEG